jgi:hypothetical protein
MYQSAIINMDVTNFESGGHTFFEGKAYGSSNGSAKAYDTAMKYVQARTQRITRRNTIKTPLQGLCLNRSQTLSSSKWDRRNQHSLSTACVGIGSTIGKELHRGGRGGTEGSSAALFQ